MLKPDRFSCSQKIQLKRDPPVYTSLYALQADTESLFEYMRALASQELNPMIIPPVH